MTTSAEISHRLTRTTVRGWAVLVLNRAQYSSIVLAPFAFGIFLPFIREDLDLTALEVGILQGVWWVTWSATILPFGAWFSRFRPVPMVAISLVLLVPFVFMQGFSTNFITLLASRLLLVLFYAVGAPSRPLLFQQWAAPGQYASVNAVGLSLHSLIMALAVSVSPLLIGALGSWRIAYHLQGGLMLTHLIVWMIVARESRAPIADLGDVLKINERPPFGAILRYPHGWYMGFAMFSLAATWTSIVTFLPTILLDDYGVSVSKSAPLMGFMYYALILGSLLGGFINRRVPNRRALLAVPVVMSAALAVLATMISQPALLAACLTGIGLAWVAVPAIEMLPFELPGILPREVAVISALSVTLFGLGFAIGPLFVGIAAQISGSAQTGLLMLTALTGLGSLAGVFYPRYRRSTLQPS
ncbi:MAG: MFS transporter [SAR202 cluster bacterium]|nr:MFS transporter [SAR202 cluster bacterium]